jgi:ankyrin repeat protein
MVLNKIINRLILITGLVILFSFRLTGQGIAIDTSGYLPLFYDNALDYNLMIAASDGYSSEVERLIHKGADIEAETSEGATPLIIAVSANRLDAVKTLLNYNADPNKITSVMESPLLISVKNNNVEISEALIRNGADIDFQDKYGVTPLNYASLYGYFYVVDLLIYYRADLEKKAKDGSTPLMSAVLARYADISDLLIQNGANLEARDNLGFTPLLIAAQNGDTLLINILLKNGVDLFEINIFNWNALDLAIKTNHKDAADLLIKKGIIGSGDKAGSVNPYYLAAKYRRKEIIDLLEKNNVPGKYKPRIDQMAISVSAKFSLKDFYTGLSFSFKEPLSNFGVIGGFDTKLWYTRVLVKVEENIYYQYMDKSSAAYLGVFKDFPLTNNIVKGNFYLSPSLSAAYSFGNKFKGTELVPENKLRALPAISVKWQKNNFLLFSDFEVLSTDFYRIGPFWGRIGCSYNFFFDNVRAPVKVIRWF